MSSPQQSVETKKKNFANYRIFGFWLANHLKDEGLIDVETCGKLIGAQKTFEAKDAQEEFYGKFFAALPDVTKDMLLHIFFSAIHQNLVRIFIFLEFACRFRAIFNYDASLIA